MPCVRVLAGLRLPGTRSAGSKQGSHRLVNWLHGGSPSAALARSGRASAHESAPCRGARHHHRLEGNVPSACIRPRRLPGPPLRPPPRHRRRLLHLGRHDDALLVRHDLVLGRISVGVEWHRPRLCHSQHAEPRSGLLLGHGAWQGVRHVVHDGCALGGSFSAATQFARAATTTNAWLHARSACRSLCT